MMRKASLIYLLLILEGYVVLAAELLAIRQLIPFVGSGTEVVSVIISAVLLPLAAGYHYGSQAKPRGTVRGQLRRNALVALSVFAVGLSYVFLELFFTTLQTLGIHSLVLQTAIYALLFLVWPTFLLAQTLPLATRFFKGSQLHKATGKMLFFSTAGSFLGSVFSTLVLMRFAGVHITVLCVLGLLALFIGLATRRRTISYDWLLAALALGVGVFLNSPSMMGALGIVSDNQYNTIAIRDMPEKKAKMLVVNRSGSSLVSPDRSQRFDYIKAIEAGYLASLQKSASVRDVLVIGAGGFTLGDTDDKHRYAYVDIDPDMQKVVEKHFLPAPLGANKKFFPMSARAYLRQDKGLYDLIILDAYTNTISLPMECTSREFFEAVKARLKPGGVVVANVVASPVFGDKFTTRYHNTFAAVFPRFSREVVTGFDAWAEKPGVRNTLYVYFNRDTAQGDETVYTDDKNSFSSDR